MQTRSMGGYYGAFARGNGPSLAGRENRIVCRLGVVPEELVAILRRHRRDQFGDTQVARANKLGLVSTTRNGTPLEPRNVNRALEALCRRANVRSIRLHDLWHSRGTLLFAMGVEAATVQRILRRSSISVTTGTYVNVIEQVQRAAVAGMDSLLSPTRVVHDHPWASGLVSVVNEPTEARPKWRKAPLMS